MNKVFEDMYPLETGDEYAIKELQRIMAQFPDRKKFRVEAFISPKFIRISVYKVDLRK